MVEQKKYEDSTTFKVEPTKKSSTRGYGHYWWIRLFASLFSPFLFVSAITMVLDFLGVPVGTPWLAITASYLVLFFVLLTLNLVRTFKLSPKPHSTTIGSSLQPLDTVHIGGKKSTFKELFRWPTREPSYLILGRFMFLSPSAFLVTNYSIIIYFFGFPNLGFYSFIPDWVLLVVALFIIVYVSWYFVSSQLSSQSVFESNA